MSGIFGWSYPPGCSGPPDNDLRCEVCGKYPHDCVCPECPSCGVQGDPACYADGGCGLVRSLEQIACYRAAMEAEEAQIEAEHEYWSKRIEEDENTG